MKEENIEFLNQLMKSLKKAEEKLSIAYQNNDRLYFEKVRKFIEEIQAKIMEIIA